MSVRRTPMLLAAGALLVTSALAGCGGGAHAATATLTVGFVVDPSWAQIPVAQKAGYFAKDGITVKVVNFSTGVEALTAVEGGQVDVTTAADVPVASALAKDTSLRVAADGSRWNGSKIVARKGSNIRTFADLAGKKVGTPLGTSAQYFADTAMQLGHVTAQLVQVGPPAIVPALTQGNVAAVSIFEPYQIQAEQALGADAVVLSPPAGAYSQHSLYVAKASTIAAKSRQLKLFFQAIGQAGADLGAGKSAAIAAVSAATTLKPDLVGKVLSEFDFTLQLKPSLAQGLASLATWAKKNQLLDAATAAPDYAARLDGSTLPAGSAT